MKNKVEVKPIIIFIGLSYLIVSFVFYILAGGNIPEMTNPLDSWKLFLLMYSPALAAYLTAKICRETFLTKSEIFGSLNLWHVVALLLPIGLMILCSGYSLILFPHLSFNPNLTGAIEFNDEINWDLKAQMISQMALAPSKNLFVQVLSGISQAWGMAMFLAFGEELGWRGYLLKKVEKLGFWPAVLIIGPVWGLWHFPLILKGYNYPTNPNLGVLMMMVACTALTPLMIYIRRKANSVWSAAIFHGSFNTFSYLALVGIHGTSNSFQTTFLGISGALASLTIYFLFQIKISKSNINKSEKVVVLYG